MKTFNFLENLLRREFVMSGMSGMNGLRVDAVNPDSKPTVNRQSRLTSVQRHDSVSVATIARQWLKYAAMTVMLFTINVGNAWATDETLVLTFNGATNAYEIETSSSSSENTFTQGTITMGYKSCTDNSASGAHYFMFAKGYGVLYNKTELPGAITNVKVEYRDGTSEKSNLGVKCGSSKMDTRQTSSLNATLTTDGGSYDDCDIAEASGYKYFNISIQGGSGKDYGNIQVTKITITYSAASCGSTTPTTTGTASLNGSFNMTSTTSAIGVASGTWAVGSNCSWSDYGFVWSDGSTTTTPTVSNNKVQVGTTGNGTSWTGSVTPSNSTTPTAWETGHTYYVRAYGKNDHGSATYAYGSAWTFTPQSVTFYANTGSGSMDVQYVQGGVSTALTANSFTKSGYTFNGWNTDADGTSGTGYNNQANVNLGADLTLYAKWQANGYTITLNNQSAETAGSTSISVTFDANTNLTGTPAITVPEKTGYTFGGYYTAKGGSGVKIIDENGDIVASASGGGNTYTDASKNWKYANGIELYAKWTIQSYAITWLVSGESWSGKGGSANADYNTAWSSLTLPTAPTTSDGCGQKFVGWTPIPISTALDKTDDASEIATLISTNLLNTANQSGKTSTYITEPTTFHAVFADYDE